MSGNSRSYISPYSIITVFVLFTIIGIGFSFLIPVRLNPNNRQPKLTITFSYRDAAPSVVEQELTNVIEGALGAVEGVRNITSRSSQGQGSVQLTFARGEDMDMRRYEVSSIIRHLHPQMPEGMSFPNISIGNNEDDDNRGQAILIYNVLSDKSQDQLEQFVNRRVISRLSMIEDVSGVQLAGLRPIMWEITYDYHKLHNMGLTPDVINTAFRNAQQHVFCGYDETSEDGYKMAVTVHQTIEGIVGLKSMPVTTVGGRVIYLKDIAFFKRRKDTRNSLTRINGLDQVSLRVFADPEANRVRLAKRVREEIEQIEIELEGEIDLILRRDTTEFIEEEINSIILRSSATLIILLLFLFIIHRNIKDVMVVSLSLITTLGVACIGYYLLGVQLHLFSFAGITITFGLLIDNAIIMMEHKRFTGNRNVFLAILAATLTTITALVIVFFLNQQLRLRLQDFSTVIIINLIVSLIVALFYIPALMDVMGYKDVRKQKRGIGLNTIGRINRINRAVFVFMNRFKKYAFMLFVLAFGLPVFLMPENVKEDNFWGKWYNKTIGTDTYKYEVRSIVNKTLGGALRLVLQGNYDDEQKERTETSIRIFAQMPKGSSMSQTETMVKQVENFLSQFDEHIYYESNIRNPEYAEMEVFFKEEQQESNLPNFLTERLSSVANRKLGSAEWQVIGEGNGFNNSTLQQSGAFRIFLYGFDYNELLKYALLVKDTVELNPRTENHFISGQLQTFRTNTYQHILDVDQKRIAQSNSSIRSMLEDMRHFTQAERRIGGLFDEHTNFQVITSSLQKSSFDQWKLENNLFRESRINALGLVRKDAMAESIFKVNQQYQLVLDFDYIGLQSEGRRFVKETIKEFEKTIPLGFRVSDRRSLYENRQERQSNTNFIFYVIIAIYIICAILLNSFWQPLAVIFMIPISFIGAFFSFSLFEVTLNDGAYASLILLAGLTVNSALYIINDLNSIRNRIKSRNEKFLLLSYMKAFNHKIIPILLTIVSTVLGMIPFLATGKSEQFWFPLALGTVGGLLFSLVAIYVYLPLFFVNWKKLKKTL